MGRISWFPNASFDFQELCQPLPQVDTINQESAQESCHLLCYLSSTDVQDLPMLL